MPTIIIDTDVNSNSGYVYPIGVNNSNYILLPGVSITANAAVFFESNGVSGTTLDLSGNITSAAAFIAVLQGAGADVSLAATALAVSNWTDTFGAYPAFSISGASSSFSNAGTIQTALGIGVGLYGAGSTGTNSGLIDAGQIGAELGTSIAFTNTGTITADRSGTDNAGISITGHDTTVVNEGGIEVSGSGLAAGIAVSGTGSSITNSGSIDSTTGWGIRNAGADASVTLTVVNSGTIGGLKGSILGGVGADRITNTGELVGDVRLGAGNDIFDGRGGTLTGQVIGGTGADVYRVSDAGIVIVETGSDIDRVEATVNFTLNGRPGLENLTLLAGALEGTGNALKNYIVGNGANNTLSGRGENDALDGKGGADTLYGDFGRDTLSGAAGADMLHGGNGADVLVGGTGRDTLVGGAENDVFKFNWFAESSPGAANRDVIDDFVVGEDIIDLSVIDARHGVAGNQAFTFIGTAAFSANGQLRLDTSGPQLIVEGDLNDDRVADFQIVLNGIATLSASDFVL